MNLNAFPGRFILAADITLTSPMNIAAVEKGRYSFEGQRQKITRFDAGPTAPGLQCTLTRSQRVMVDAVSSDEGEESPGQVGADIPVIPASTVAGKVRHMASSLILDSLRERGLHVSTDVYNMLHTGSATTEINASDATPQIVFMARRDPFFGNFGGTSFLLSSHSVISTGWPLIQMTRDFLMSPELLPTESLPDLKWMSQMTSAMALVRKDSVLDMRGEHLGSTVTSDDVANYAQAKGEEAAASKVSKAKQRDAKASGEYVAADKKRDLRTLSAFEGVNTGMSFALRLRVDATTPAQLGLMVLALQRALQQGQIGGRAARGFGQFTCNASRLISLDQRTNRITDVNGQPLFLSRNEGYEVSGLSDDQPTPLVNAVTAAKDYLHEVNPLLLEAFAKGQADALIAHYEEGVAA